MYHQSLRHTCGQTMHHHRTDDDERDVLPALPALHALHTLHTLPPAQRGSRETYTCFRANALRTDILALPDPPQHCVAANPDPACIAQRPLHDRSQRLGQGQSISGRVCAHSQYAVDAIDGARSWYAIADDRRARTHGTTSDGLAHAPSSATHIYSGQTRLARLIAI